MSFIEKCNAIKSRAIYEPELIEGLPPAQDTHKQKFEAYHRAYPEIYEQIKRIAITTTGRISVKKIYEQMRGKFKHLDNSFTADYADLLCDDFPWMAQYIERRRRADRKMRLIYRR